MKSFEAENQIIECKNELFIGEYVNIIGKSYNFTKSNYR